MAEVLSELPSEVDVEKELERALAPPTRTGGGSAAPGAMAAAAGGRKGSQVALLKTAPSLTGGG